MGTGFLGGHEAVTMKLLCGEDRNTDSEKCGSDSQVDKYKGCEMII